MEKKVITDPIVEGWELCYNRSLGEYILFSVWVFNHPRLGTDRHLITTPVIMVGEDDGGSVWVQTLNTKYYLGEAYAGN